MIKRLALIDADTLIYQAAAVIQEAPLIVEHKLSKRKKEFKNKTEWAEFLKSDKGRGYSDDDFNVVQEPRLKEDISHALHILKNSVEKITKKDWCEDYMLFIGGQGNYRKDLATMKEYKSGRPAKPLAFQDCYDFILKKFKGRVKVCDGIEAEDGVAIKGWTAYHKARSLKNKDASDVVICHVDKDLLQVPGFHYNYGKDSDLFWVTDVEAASYFWAQMLKGDPTDSILGLEGIGEQTKKQYQINISKGCGEKSAEKILNGTKNEKEMVDRVVKAYQDFYKKDWEKPFNENGILLRMQSVEDERWCAVEYARKLGVEV